MMKNIELHNSHRIAGKVIIFFIILSLTLTECMWVVSGAFLFQEIDEPIYLVGLRSANAQEKKITPKTAEKSTYTRSPVQKKSEKSAKEKVNKEIKRGDPVIGEQLFIGKKSFINGGPPCVLCHKLGGRGIGTSGPDLMLPNERYGVGPAPSNPLIAAAWINSIGTPIMGGIYSKYKITDKEVEHLKAFFYNLNPSFYSEGEEGKKYWPDVVAREFPDGLIGRRYNFVLAPTNDIPPYHINLISGILPLGLNFNQDTGVIEGEPTQTGKYDLIFKIVDTKKKGEFLSGTLQVKRVLRVGEHGTFKGFDGFQMALNAAQDTDEIRIEAGKYEVTGLLISETKAWELGIKISGGWDETFERIVPDREKATILDGGVKISRIITLNQAKGYVKFEYLTFQNSKGGAIEIRKNAQALIDHLTFINNSASDSGGAVHGDGTFTNCTFANNSTAYSGGAVYGKGTFMNCTFTNNSAGGGGAVFGNGRFTNCTFTNNTAANGGAVFGDATFTNCSFTNNSATSNNSAGGGAVHGNGTFTNCTFVNNSSSYSGGAALGNGTFINCSFINNSASDSGGAVFGNGRFTNCTFTNNAAANGGAVYGESTYTACKFIGNSAKGSGGAVNGWRYLGGKTPAGTFTNSIFSMNSASGSGGAVMGDGNFTNCLLNKNVSGEGGAITGNQVTITNSTFYNNQSKGQDGAFYGDGNIVSSIFYSNSPSDVNSKGNLKIDYCLVNTVKGSADYGPHNIMGDPKFVDPENGDFHLQKDSPCIDAGIGSQTFTADSVDIDGKPRFSSSSIDIGAFEVQEVPPPPPPSTHEDIELTNEDDGGIISSEQIFPKQFWIGDYGAYGEMSSLKGVITPLVLYNNGQWTTPWPDPEYLENKVTKITQLKNLPVKWLGNIDNLPTEWYLWPRSMKPNKIKISGALQYDTGCLYQWGLVTDNVTIDEDLKPLLATTSKLNMTPIVNVKKGSEEAKKIIPVIESMFKKREDEQILQVKNVWGISRNYLKYPGHPLSRKERDKQRIVLEKLMKSKKTVGEQDIYYFETTRSYAKPADFQDRGCKSVTVFNGWLQNKNGYLSILDSNVFITDCDNKEVAREKPEVIFTIDADNYLISKMFGYESLDYVIRQITGNNIPIIIRKSGGGC